MIFDKKENPIWIIKINNEIRLQVLFVFFWIYNSLIMSSVNFVTGYLGLADYADAIRIALIVAVLIFASPAIIKYIRFRHLVFYLVVMLVYGITFVLFPENTKWLEENIIEFAFLILPFIFLGFMLNKMRLPYQALVICSRLIIVMMIVVFLFFSMVDTETHEMGRAYVVLPSVMLVTHSMLKKWNIWDMAVTIAGFIFLLMCATRGPIVIYIIFVFLQLSILSEKHRKFYIFLLVTIILLGLSPLGNLILRWIMEKFNGAGFNVRIFEYLLSGNLMDDNGRDFLTEKVFEMIRNHPLIGNGIYSDRLATSSLSWLAGEGSYVHNIVYELWCDFGYIIGTLLLVVFIYWAIKTYKNNFGDNDFRAIFCILMFSYVMKLLMSSSYLSEPGFWLCLGMCYECSGRKYMFKKRQI